MKYVSKHSGKTQLFNSKKLSASLEKTLISNQYKANTAKEIADEITNSTMRWMLKKSEVTTIDIRNHVAKELSKIDKPTALVYKKHKDLW